MEKHDAKHKIFKEGQNRGDCHRLKMQCNILVLLLES